MADLFATIAFLRQWWLVILIGVGVVLLLPGVLPSIVRFFTETKAGRYIAIGFLAVGGVFFAFLSAFNAGKATAYRDRLAQTQAKLKAPPAPKKKADDWLSKTWGRR